ncbi:MAG: insulinase family protein [Clostridia bacterium]|nr:insulinase family protein [Clostridia bacterium]
MDFNTINGVSFRLIPETRFKTAGITLTLACPLTSEGASPNALLPYMLVRSCRKYPDFSALKKKLALLYGAKLSADVISLGDAQLLRISVYSIDDRYTMNGEAVSVECVKLLADILTDPAFVGGVFSEADLEAEKRQLCEQIDAQTNDKVAYAKRRCIDLMCAGQPFGINPLGDKASINAITAEQLTETWKTALSSYPISLTAVGAMDGDMVFTAFSDALSSAGRTPAALPAQSVSPRHDNVREFTEREDVTQSKLLIGFTTPINGCEHDISAMRLFNACFGGTPHSRLFANVREKMSLCYYCSSSYYRNKGILLVGSGLESENIEKAKTEIIAQLSDIQSGGLTDSEIENAKLSLRNSFLRTKDSVSATEGWYTAQMFDRDCISVEEACRRIDAVTKEDVTQAARSLDLDTVYLLTGKEEQ